MTGKLASEIRQTKPFGSLGEEALLNLVRTHEYVQQRQSEFLKPYGLTLTQYNVLRILRGAGSEGLACSQVGERMLTADPDITRLLDRLETRALIVRERSTEDRRVVVTRIGKDGLDLLKKLDKPLLEQIQTLVGHIGEAELKRFIETLESIRRA